MNSHEVLDTRFQALITKGDALVQALPRAYEGRGLAFHVEDHDVPQFQAWLSATVSLLQIVALPGSHYIEEAERLVKCDDMQMGVSCQVVQKMYGLLTSAYADWQTGLLRQIEYVVAAATFDDFLDHASSYHKGNKKTESAVLGSAVLEDTVKKIARKNRLEPSGLSLEPLIDELTKIGVFTLVKAKRIKGYTAVRNHTSHAEWDKFDIRDVGELIKGTRELIEEFL